MTSITVNVLVEGSSQCDQIGRFLKVLDKKFLLKK